MHTYCEGMKQIPSFNEIYIRILSTAVQS